MSQPAALEDLNWTEDAVDKLAMWAKSGLMFTAADLRNTLRPAPHPNMVGAAFRIAKGRGLIQSVGYEHSTTPSRHGAVLRTWEGVPAYQVKANRMDIPEAA